MGKLAELRAERARITTEYDEAKRSIHANYMNDLHQLEKRTEAARRVLGQRHRAALNAALEILDGVI